jgi:hypothetical protein
MPALEAMGGVIERRIDEEAATLSEFEAQQMTGSNPFAGT